MTHLITEKNIFIPIQKCYIENSGLELVFDIKDIIYPKYDDILKFYNNNLLKQKYIPNIVINDNTKQTLIFDNKSYIPININNTKIKIKIKEGIDLFQIDKQICLQNDDINKNFEYIENIDIIIENIEEYIGYMSVEFKNKYKRYSNIKEIEKYKINNIYKKEKIINILKNDYNSNIGTIYTYSDLLDTINNTLKDESINRDHKINILYDIIKKLSDKTIEKCTNIELIKRNKLEDIFLKRFIELLCIYGIDKKDKINIYNCGKEIELHMLNKTVNNDEIFIPYMEDILDYITTLFNKNIYIN